MYAMKSCASLSLVSALLAVQVIAGCHVTEPGTETGLVSIALFHNADDARGPGAGTAFAMITDPEDDGIINLAECQYNRWALATIDAWTFNWDLPGRGTLGCLEALPAEGGSAVADIDIRHRQTRWGGEITVGGVELRQDRFVPDWFLGVMDAMEVAPVYPGVFETLPTGSAGLVLGGAFVPYAGTADFDWPDAVVATSPDPTEFVHVSTGDTVDFAWTPGTSGDLFLLAGVVRNRVHKYPASAERYSTATIADLPPLFEVHGLHDSAGSYTYDVDDLGFEPPFDAGVVILRRWTNTSVDASGSTARINAVSDQWFYIEYTDVQGWTELDETTIVDSCADAAALAALPAGHYYGDLSGLASDWHPTPYDGYLDYCGAPRVPQGREGIVRVDLVDGQKLTASLRQPHHDAVLYRLDSSCTMLPGYNPADITRTGGTEELSYTAVGAEIVYLVVDTRGEDSGGLFSLTIEIE